MSTSTETSTPSTFSATPHHHRSYRCYNCNHAFHITATAAASTTAVNTTASFRCPSCFHRHLLPNYTVAPTPPPPPPQQQPSTADVTDGVTLDTSEPSAAADSDSDSDSDSNFSFGLFNPADQVLFPTAKSFVDSLPSVKIEEESSSCSICMEEFEVNSEATRLPCKHFFHKDCVVPWLNQNSTCPLCRYKLPEANIVEEFYEELEVYLNGIGIDIDAIARNSNNNVNNNSNSSGASVSATTPGGRVRTVRRSLRLRGESGEYGVEERDREEMQDEDGDILMVDA